ncbi:hypothetical protein BDM02DRAFT_1684009 [Thelephora ganbajun]|uniref:Uncharacterized protein n=1 Tax=Thelephora ganbajun TaxID=370292 RepID=A0ACB6ZKP5_THEGA|nr:hypothetical protein BDM02DRAFT_1684009 [Thelephora ganbajun]
MWVVCSPWWFASVNLYCGLGDNLCLLVNACRRLGGTGPRASIERQEGVPPEICPSWNNDGNFTDKVTCSVPFTTPDGRGLMAIGCAEGIWIGFKHDPRSMRPALHPRMVSQCVMLEHFGIFLVLADKSFFTYHIEGLVPRHTEQRTLRRQLKNLVGTRTCNSLPSGTLVAKAQCSLVRSTTSG